MAKQPQKDGRDMRVIAWVTLLFLLGTFTATFFSPTLFNFLAAGNTSVVPTWIWLYCLTSFALTAIVLIVWYKFSPRKQGQGLPTLGDGHD